MIYSDQKYLDIYYFSFLKNSKAFIALKNNIEISLSELADIKLGYSFREAVTSEENGDVNVISAKNISESTVELNSAIKIQNRKFKSDHFLSDRDIVINTRLNFKAGIYFWKNNDRTILSSPLIVIKIKDKNSLLAEYLNIHLNSSAIQQQLNVAADIGAVPFIGLSQVKNLNVVIPSIERQKKIIQFDKLFKKEQEISNKIMILKNKLYSKIIDDLTYG